MMPRTSNITAAALLAFCCISPAIGQDDDTSRSVRIIDGPPISASPPSVTANPSAVPPEPPLADKPENDTPREPATSSNSREQNPLPGTGLLPTRLPGANSSGTGAPVLVNPADLSIEMLPETSVVVGSRVSFRITAKKPGFLILVDIDSAGKVTQIYPSPVSLMAGEGKPNGNFIRPGKPIQIPSPVDPNTGFEFVASPPLGNAVVVAMLSDQPVQMIDLPEIPVSLVGQNAAVNFFSAFASELRIPSNRGDENQLQQPTWSLSAKFYEIKQAPN